MSPPTPQPNAKRYWGDEKNIDSIYSIYLKKISYSSNNDISVTSSDKKESRARNRIKHHDEDGKSSASASSIDLTKSKSRNTSVCTSNKSFNEDSKNQSSEDSPREKKRFFQRYRRRSCSMDKYSIEKHQHNSSSPVSQDKTMRYTLGKKESPLRDIKHGADNDEVDCYRKEATVGGNSESSRLDFPEQRLNHESSTQSLQWETRQIRVLQAATLDHTIKFILLINCVNSSNPDTESQPPIDMSSLEDERNNVAHIIHVLFCTYRIYTNPYELMLKLMDHSKSCRIEQYRFVMHYWMDNYPEDFEYIIEPFENGNHRDTSSTNDVSAPSVNSYNYSITSCDSSVTTKTAATTDSENSTGLTESSQSGSDNLNRRSSNSSSKAIEGRSDIPLVTAFLRLNHDDYLKDKAMKLDELRCNNMLNRGSTKSSRYHNQSGSSRSSAVLDFDSRFVAQQLTAMDLENFLNIKPYSLLEGTRSDKRVQKMVKNFNLLSRHVVVTILKSHSPHVVATHWIAIAMNLRKIKNFNSLKAIIAGLTNEAIYRLKQVVWTKLDRTSLANFKIMASVVDDVNNQTVLRQTQLIVEGTAKMSIEDDSFGTIPYLGTFLTDLNMIDARYQSYITSPMDENCKLKLINFEKCAKQFEILTQVQLLQKNVLASLHAIQRRNHFDEQTSLNKLKVEFNQTQKVLQAKPAIPQVSRLFENWFFDSNVSSMTDKQW